MVMLIVTGSSARVALTFQSTTDAKTTTVACKVLMITGSD